MQGEDETALEILYNRYAGLIFTLALRIVGDPELAREVLQDTFLRCWDGRETYDAGRGRVPWWLMGIARNRAIDLLRSRPHQARLREREQLAVVIAEARQPDATDSLPMRHGAAGNDQESDTRGNGSVTCCAQAAHRATTGGIGRP